MGVTAKKFGNLTSGEEITLYHLENKSGAYAEVMDYGAILVKLCVPDKDGELTDVVLGYDDVQQYEVNGCFFGCDHRKKRKSVSQVQIFPLWTGIPA